MGSSTVDDFDNISMGWYLFLDNKNVLSNSPLGIMSWGVVFHQELETGVAIQFAYVATYGAPKMYYIASRTRGIEGTGWNAWRYVQIST